MGENLSTAVSVLAEPQSTVPADSAVLTFGASGDQTSPQSFHFLHSVKVTGAGLEGAGRGHRGFQKCSCRSQLGMCQLGKCLTLELPILLQAGEEKWMGPCRTRRGREEGRKEIISHELETVISSGQTHRFREEKPH